MQQIEAGKANGILVWHPNRLARNAYDGGLLITLMDEGKLMEIRTPHRIYRNTPDDKFFLQLEFGIAKKIVRRQWRGRETRLENEAANGLATRPTASGISEHLHAEGAGLEPASPLRDPGFQDRCLAIRRNPPLGLYTINL